MIDCPDPDGQADLCEPSHTGDGTLFASAKLGFLDELELKRELSDLCHRAAVPDWQRLVKTIFDGIAAAGRSKDRWTDSVRRLLREIKALVERIAALESSGDQVGAEEVRKQILRLLEGAALNFRSWET